MKKKPRHNIEDVNSISRKFFSKHEINFASSREATWKKLEEKLDESDANKNLKQFPISSVRDNGPYMRHSWIAIAASVAVFIAVAAFLRYYTVTIESSNGSDLFVLRDDTEIELQEGSTLKYHPAWWWMNRDVRFEGVAEFKVTKGNRFRVISKTGTTEVLGTTFKIETGDKKYSVECYSGSVKVSDPATEISAILTANEKAELKAPGVFDIQIILDENSDEKISSDFITFKQESVAAVFDKLEDRFGVKIEYESSSNYQYSGNFRSDMNLEELLSLICLPLGLNYDKVSKDTYRITAGKELP